jgi:hyaluronate lyase
LLDTVTVNQTLNGSQWNLLGIYVFSGTARVTLSADPASTASVNADAIRFVPVAPQSTEITIDNLGAGASSVGSWYVSGGPNPWGANSMVTWTPGETFTFSANLVSGKSYAVYAWWTESSCRYTAVPYQILNGAIVLDTVVVNQTANGGKWNLLGTYTFTGAASVVIRSAPSSGYSTNADAVRFVPAA